MPLIKLNTPESSQVDAVYVETYVNPNQVTHVTTRLGASDSCLVHLSTSKDIPVLGNLETVAALFK